MQRFARLFRDSSEGRSLPFPKRGAVGVMMYLFLLFFGFPEAPPRLRCVVRKEGFLFSLENPFIRSSSAPSPLRSLVGKVPRKDRVVSTSSDMSPPVKVLLPSWAGAAISFPFSQSRE